MTIAQINERALRLWNNQSYSSLVPQLYPEDLIQNTRDCILFVGLNPSFSEQGYHRFLRDTPYEQYLAQLRSFYEMANYRPEKLAIYTDINKISKDRYAYFKPFREISELLGLSWEHIDLFVTMETQQSNVKTMYKRAFAKRNQNNDLRMFFEEQLNIFTDLMGALSPKLIVVPNALASDIIKQRFGLKFNERLGTYLWDEKTPIFLGSQFTGGASDKYSLERLKWHLQRCVQTEL